MSTEASETKNPQPAAGVAKEAPTEQQESRAGAPKRFAKGQTVCNERNEKGKLCNGHLKQVSPVLEDALEHLRGNDLLYKCQTCGTLYMGPPLGHVRDPRKQTRFVEKELVEILQAAGGTLPAFKRNASGALVPVTEAGHGAHAPAARPTAAAAATPAAKAATPAAAPAPPPAKPAEPEETPEQKRARKLAEAEARKATAVPIPGASGPPPEGETPEQKIARLKAVVAEAKRRKEAAGGGDVPAPAAPTDLTPSAPPPPAPTSGTDSSPAADAHRPAAEAQAATGVASAAPLSPAAATASPAAGAETVADLAPEASTELTPGAPKAATKSGSHTGFKVPAELQPKEGETQEEKIARLRRIVEEAKRAEGKL